MAVVTVNTHLRNLKHDPRNKQTGECPFSPLCTDVTGDHHSTILTGITAEDIMAEVLKLRAKYWVTRVEMIPNP